MAPVHGAAARNDVEELGRLLDEDPELIEADSVGTPLYYACDAGSVEAARLLLDRGADVNRRDSRGWTPIIGACHYGYVDMVSWLLDRGADPSVRTVGGSTALILASSYDHGIGSDYVAVIRLLIKDGRVPVDARDSAGCTALWRACHYGYTERARVLLVEGCAHHGIAGRRGSTPMAVAEGGCTRLLQWYEGELHRAFLLSRARAVLDATHTITKAPKKSQAKGRTQAQRAREEAAPAWLRRRVRRGEALPDVAVVRQTGQHDDDKEEEEEEERDAVCRWLVSVVSEDLHLELMEGLRYRRWVPR